MSVIMASHKLFPSFDQILKYASDRKMCDHQKYHINKMRGNCYLGDAPLSTNNICLLYTSSKMLATTALLSLHVNEFQNEPQHIIAERLQNHLLAIKADIDLHALESFLTAIISNLLASSDLLDDLNQKRKMAEDKDKCTAYLNSTKSCVNIIRSITMWLNLILGRAKFIMKVLNSDDVLLQLSGAIKVLGNAKFFLFVTQSLTKVLTTIASTASNNMFSKVLMNDGCLEHSFRSCLGAMRSSIALVNVCKVISGAPEIYHSRTNKDWSAAAEAYLSFVVSS